MNPKLQAGVELVLEKMAAEEQASSLSGILTQKYAEAMESNVVKEDKGKANGNAKAGKNDETEPPTIEGGDCIKGMTISSDYGNAKSASQESPLLRVVRQALGKQAAEDYRAGSWRKQLGTDAKPAAAPGKGGITDWIGNKFFGGDAADKKGRALDAQRKKIRASMPKRAADPESTLGTRAGDPTQTDELEPAKSVVKNPTAEGGAGASDSNKNPLISGDSGGLNTKTGPTDKDVMSYSSKKAAAFKEAYVNRDAGQDDNAAAPSENDMSYEKPKSYTPKGEMPREKLASVNHGLLKNMLAKRIYG